MRYVDIYQELFETVEGQRVAYYKPIATNCLQIGSPTLTRTPNATRFTLASGAPGAYPSELDAATCTIELECSATQARAIAKAVRLTRLIFAGMSIVTTARQTTLPEITGTPAIITGGVSIQECYGGSGIYRVTIPLQIELQSSGAADSCAVPAFAASDLTIDSTGSPADYKFRKDGVFHRSGVYVTTASSCAIGYETEMPDGIKSDATFGAQLIKIGGYSTTSSNLEDTLSVNLDKGENVLQLQLNAASQAAKAAIYRMTVFRG